MRSEQLFTVGLIAPHGQTRIDPKEAAFLRGVALEAGARPRLVRGSAESLFLDLEEGELDLVLGEVAPASPWMTRLTFLRPIEEQVDQTRHLLVTPIAKNGENAWIMLLEKVDTQVAASLDS